MDHSQLQSVINKVFDDIRNGKNWAPLQSLIRPEQEAAHIAHVRRIHNPEYQSSKQDEVNNDAGVYNPEVSSSTFMMIRALLSFYEPAKFYEQVLELGAGSGGVSIYLKQHRFGKFFTLTDIATAAIESAKKNLNRLGLANDTRVIESDLFNNVTGRYDAIIFNAPLWHKKDAIAEELALVDPDGVLMERFLREADQYLNEKGNIFLAFSNLCTPDLLEKYSDKWDFCLIVAEYIGYTGMIKSVYRVSRR